jgi:drug/metabolite transporter (DMT)-like permease
VIAILGGLGAAVAWAISTLCSSRSSRLIDPPSVVAWMMVVGLVITLPLVALSGVPARLGPGSVAWLATSGIGNVGGLLLTYRALRVGQVAIVAPLVSTEGAVAALIAVIAGESVAPGVAVTLLAILAGVWLASVEEAPGPREVPGPEDELEPAGALRTPTELDPSRAPNPYHAVLSAIAAALTFGVSLYATGRAGTELPVSWVAVSARAIGTVALAIPLAITGHLQITRRAVPLVITSGVCEVIGFYSYTTGARHGIAVAAVLSSQFGGLAAVAAYFLFGERLSRKRTLGVCTMLAGVAVLSALQA